MFSNVVQHYGYLALAVVIFVECVGVPLPGESALIALAVYAGTTHQANPYLVGATAAAAAIGGDNLGYYLGRRHGPGLVAKATDRWPRAAAYAQLCTRLFDRHGLKVVFFGRFVGVLRTWSAFFAGLNRLHWGSFLKANISGGLVWAGAWTAAAYLLGDAVSRFGHWATLAGIALAVALSASLAISTERHFRVERRATARIGSSD